MTPPDPAFIIRAKARNPAASEPDELRSVPKCAPKRQLCALRNANYAICVPMFAHSAFRRALRNANRVSQEIGAIRAPRMAVWRGGLGQWHVWQSRKVRPRGREENTAMRYAARGRRPKPRIACITRHTRPSRRRTVARWQIHDWQPAVAPRSSRPIRTIWSSAAMPCWRRCASASPACSCISRHVSSMMTVHARSSSSPAHKACTCWRPTVWKWIASPGRRTIRASCSKCSRTSIRLSPSWRISPSARPRPWTW